MWDFRSDGTIEQSNSAGSRVMGRYLAAGSDLTITSSTATASNELSFVYVVVAPGTIVLDDVELGTDGRPAAGQDDAAVSCTLGRITR